MMGRLQFGTNLLKHLVNDSNTTYTSGSKIHPILFPAQGLRFRKQLQVILTTSIEKLGKAGETVKVAPGYFRNHLMPKLLAVPNIEKYQYLIREQRKLYQREEIETITVVPKTEEDKMKEYQNAAKHLVNAHLGLRRLIKTGNDLQAPVTKDELVTEVSRQLCVSIRPENLHLPSPLSTLGEYEVPLRLPRSIPLPDGKTHWSLKVKIRRK